MIIQIIEFTSFLYGPFGSACYFRYTYQSPLDVLNDPLDSCGSEESIRKPSPESALVSLLIYHSEPLFATGGRKRRTHALDLLRSMGPFILQQNIQNGLQGRFLTFLEQEGSNESTCGSFRSADYEPKRSSGPMMPEHPSPVLFPSTGSFWRTPLSIHFFNLKSFIDSNLFYDYY